VVHRVKIESSREREVKVESSREREVGLYCRRRRDREGLLRDIKKGRAEGIAI